MAAPRERTPFCAIQGMSKSHYASWADVSRAVNTIAVLCVHCDGNYRRSPITSIQSRRCSLIISICTTKAITGCCSKTRIRTCTHMHMHNHMFINYGIEGDRRSLPLPALRSKASVRTCTHMHMHTHKQHTHVLQRRSLIASFIIWSSDPKASIRTCTHMHMHTHVCQPCD